MEIFSNKRWLGKVKPIITIITSVLLLACSNLDESNLRNEDGNFQIVKLENGEQIILTDTTTYVVDINEISPNSICTNVETDNLFESSSRASGTISLSGYDIMEPESDWKKYYLTEKYGVTAGYYIGRYIKVHKELPIETNTYVIPANYNSPNAPTGVMGWEGVGYAIGKGGIGFTPLARTDTSSNGVTRVFLIESDMAGRQYNRYVPANPSNFQWVYRLGVKEDLWD